MKIICTLNLKGGCAKTTTAVSMAELLATGFKSKRGAVEPGKVLLFDNDKQGNASRLFNQYRQRTGFRHECNKRSCGSRAEREGITWDLILWTL